MPPSDPPHRVLLARAIEDIQGSIHANDSKSAAGLVVHGLLATAVVTLAVHLDPIYRSATLAGHDLIKWALILTLPVAVASIFCLIAAVYPRGPGKIEKRLKNRHPGVFFPDVKTLKSSRANEFDELRPKLTELANAADGDALDDEYLAELLKVAHIRFKEARWAKLGFVLLGVEVLCVAVFLATVGSVAGDVLGAAASKTNSDKLGGMSLHWDIEQGRRRYSLTGAGNLTLPGKGGAQVRLLAKAPDGLRSVRLVIRTFYRCAVHGVARTRSAGQATEEDVRLFAAERAVLVTNPNVRPHRCSDGGRFIETLLRFTAYMRSANGTLTSGSLVLRARR
jgi:hypothetical protein